MRLYSLLTCLGGYVAAFDQNWINTNALRTVDLTKTYVKESLAIILENISEGPQATYYLPVEPNVTYSYVEAREKGKKSASAGLQVKQIGDSWEISLDNPIATGEQITLSISSVKLQNLTPLPAKIEQNGKQYLSATSTKFIPSFYRTLKEKTKFKLPNGDIASFTEGADRQGNVLIYGPYDEESLDDRKDSTSTLNVRFEHTIPLSTVTYFERDIEVSHWGGNIAFEDRYALTNHGARLKAQFDRVAFAQSAYYNPHSAAIKGLVLPLSIGSRDAYFTDEIGNVSTSKFRSSFREANLEIKPRYPIFGGWNYTFTVGWNNDLSNFLRRTGTSHYLRVPFIEGAENTNYEELRVRIILPEGANSIKVYCPVPITAEVHGIHKTFMDTTGRTVVVLEAQNLVDEKARQNILVEYEYSGLAAYRKPLVTIAAIGTIFIFSAVLSKIL